MKQVFALFSSNVDAIDAVNIAACLSTLSKLVRRGPVDQAEFVRGSEIFKELLRCVRRCILASIDPS